MRREPLILRRHPEGVAPCAGHKSFCSSCGRTMPTVEEWPECGILFANGSATACDECWLDSISSPDRFELWALLFAALLSLVCLVAWGLAS